MPEQRRFITDFPEFVGLVEASRPAVAGLDGAIPGCAPHSLRAITPDELSALLDFMPTGPVHIHVAEQEKEVIDCLAWSGRHPVEWLLDHVPVNDRWCLIHATHMTNAETVAMAGTGAVAGLCPMTEANLGDGTFPGISYLAAGGRYGIGTDSNIRIGVTDELRHLEYAQRLHLHSRNVFSVHAASTGRSLFDAAFQGGQQALGVPANGITVDAPADLVSLTTDSWGDDGGDALLNGWIFARGVAVDDVWVCGRKVVHGGRHVERDAVIRDYQSIIRQLISGQP